MVGTTLLASLVSDTALVIGAMSPLVLAIAALIFVVTKDKRQLKAEFNKFAVTLQGIDHAVNQVEPGEPPLREKVDTQGEQIRNLQSDMATVKKQLGQLVKEAKQIKNHAQTMVNHIEGEPST